MFIMKPKKLKEALLPILLINWISGLRIVEYPLGTPRFFFSFIYMIILFFGLFYVPFTEGFYICQITESSNTAAVIFDSVMAYEEFTVLIYIITSWYYQKVLESCIEKIELIDETLECLGSKDNCGLIFKILLFRLSIFFILMIIQLVTIILWFYRANFQNIFYCTFKYQTKLVLPVIIEITFATLVRCVGFSMREINLLLQRAVEKSKLEINYPVNRKHHRIISIVMSNEFNSETDHKTTNLIQLIKQLHLNLSKVGWDLNKIFGLQITIAISINIIFLILQLYYLFIGILQNQHYDYAKFLAATLVASGAIFRFLTITYLSNVCGDTAKEAKKAKEIIFELNRKSKDTELTKEIEQFAMQIGQRPLNFAICGLFTLQKRFIGTVLGVIFKYLVFLLQSESIEKQLIEFSEWDDINCNKFSN